VTQLVVHNHNLITHYNHSFMDLEHRSIPCNIRSVGNNVRIAYRWSTLRTHHILSYDCLILSGVRRK
jgi:hypothetical protein